MCHNFYINDKQKFAENTFSSLNFDTSVLNFDTTILKDKEVIEELDQAGFFDEDSYEAKIEGSYYGDEFYGFTLMKDVKNKAIKIVAVNHVINKR